MVFIDFDIFTEFYGFIIFFTDVLYSRLNRFSMTEYLELPQILSNMDQRKGPQFFPNSVS